MSTLQTEQPLILGLESAGILLTPEEFDAIEDYDESYRYELIHGVLVVNPIPLPEETSPNDLLGYLLQDYRYRHPQGSALDHTIPQQYIRTANGRRIADRVIWAGLGRKPRLTVDVPTIAVEFVSAGRRSRQRDYDEKRTEYWATGVQEYWIFDRFRRSLTVFRRAAEGFDELVVREHESYQTPLLPGFEVPLARILAAADLCTR